MEGSVWTVLRGCIWTVEQVYLAKVSERSITMIKGTEAPSWSVSNTS